MNPFYFEGTDKEKVLNIEAVKGLVIGDFYQQGYRLITVNDAKFSNCYQIKLEKSKQLGISGLCFLDGRSSYQADFRAGSGLKLSEVINNIAGGEIL